MRNRAPHRLVRGAGGRRFDLGKTSSASATRVGWTVGGGAEAMLWSNWLTRIEYRFADYGTFGYTLFPGAGACGGGCDTISAETRLRTHTVLVGFAYKFGGPFISELLTVSGCEVLAAAGSPDRPLPVVLAVRSLYTCRRAARHGASYENRRDRSARANPSLWDAGREGGRHPQEWARNLCAGGAKDARCGTMEAQELPGFGATQARRVRGCHREGSRCNSRGRT